jgi:hypothetical protein
MTAKNVFISMGAPYREPQIKFRDALMDLLRDCDVVPRVINKTDYPTGNALLDISRVLRECDGAIIVAHERTFLESGLEKRETKLSAVRYSTPWNQIEAAMAFVLGMPILVLVELGIKEEGLLEEKYDWYIERLEISPKSLSDKDVHARILAWCRKVQSGKRNRFARLRIGESTPFLEFLQSITLGAALTVLGMLGAVFVAGMAAAPYWGMFLHWLNIR